MAVAALALAWAEEDISAATALAWEVEEIVAAAAAKTNSKAGVLFSAV